MMEALAAQDQDHPDWLACRTEADAEACARAYVAQLGLPEAAASRHVAALVQMWKRSRGDGQSV
jgi:phage tail protein X